MAVAIIVHHHVVPGTPPAAVEAAFDAWLLPLVEALDADPGLRLNCRISGTLLEFAVGHRPAWVERARDLVRKERLEILGGPFHEALLPLIPERDVVAQLQYTGTFLETHFDRRPRGTWTPLRAWDPSLVGLMADCDADFTVLDDAAFIATGIAPEQAYRAWVLERSGQTFGAFALNGRASRALREADLEGLRGELRFGRRDAARLTVLSISADRLAEGLGLPALTAMLREEFHRLKSQLLTPAWRSMEPARIALPATTMPRLAEWCLPAATAGRRRRLLRHIETTAGWQDAQLFGFGLQFDQFLTKYPEANQLHKRMLRTSARVDRLRALLAERHAAGHSGPNEQTARKVLQRAAGLLWRGQDHGAFWHGGQEHEGIYDPALRGRTLRDLLGAEALVDRVLSDRKGARWLCARFDADGDGAPEALVVTPHFQAIVHPRLGGGLWELDLRQRGHALQSVLAGVEEPYHEGLAGNEVQLVDSDDADTSPGLPRLTDGQAEPRLAAATFDRDRRGAFVDHFLGPESTLASFSRRQHREAGDFGGGGWELRAYEPAQEGEPGRVVVARNGVVQGAVGGQLLSVEKSYTFDVRHPRLRFEHKLINRSRDTASVWWGLEWSFGVSASSLSAVRLRAVGGDRESLARLSDGPVDLGECSWLEWVDEQSGVAIVMEWEEPLSVWWAPVRTVHQGAAGWKEATQGNTLLLHRRRELWGEEEQRMAIEIAFHEA